MILVDGKRADVVPADDRGLAYGDGLFETLRARNGRLPLLEYHLERLFAGLRALDFPPLSEQMLRRELQTAAEEATESVVKLMITRGSGGRGYRRPGDCQPRRIVLTSPVPPDVEGWRRHGVVLRHCRTPLEGPRALDGLKHLNRLPQVLARAEWNDPGIHEGLMRDNAGHVVEGTMSNVFIVRERMLLTPPVSAGVRGVMRRLVLELAARGGIECSERVLSDDELARADEVFITNSIIGVCPVTRIDGQDYPVGTITRLLQTETEHELERRTCSDD